MPRSTIGTGALIGSLATAPLIGLMYLVSELFEIPFGPYDLFDRVTRELPGPLVTFGIDLLIDALRFVGLSVSEAAKSAERAIAILQFVLTGAVIGALYFRFTKYTDRRRSLLIGFGIGAVGGVTVASISNGIGGSTAAPGVVFFWMIVMLAGWGVGLGEAFFRLGIGQSNTLPSEIDNQTPATLTRRQFIVKVGAASAVITVASTGLGALLSDAARREIEVDIAASTGGQPVDVYPTAFPSNGNDVIAAPGTRPEYTPVKDHYSVSIGTREIDIDGATWSLPVTGLVANSTAFSISDLRNDFKPVSHFVTLSCISGRIGSDLIGTTQWTGVSVQDVLAAVQPNEEAGYLDIKSADGFHETVDLDLIRSDERIMFCYAWDGNPLPIDHGFPLRIWIPDRYGMKQPRWIESIDVVKDYREGYWVKRGWDETARVETTSVIDTVAVDSTYISEGQTFVPIGGIAFAGARGVSKVEVRVNDGPWEEARLRQPLSETTWVVWRYDWPFSPGEKVFEVRCSEADATPQKEEERGNRPSGATGLHSKRAKI